LQQVVWNLLSNAIKFTPRGGSVKVVLERVNAHLELSVTDTGKGIDPEFLPHVFERFRQADSSSTRRHGGLGLGLAIVKQLVEMHGGTVRASSSGVDQGATFVIQLPTAVFQPAEATDDAEATRIGGELMPIDRDSFNLSGINVLVVDDEPDARLLVSRLLGECEASVSVAGSTAEALNILKDARFDVLVCDIGMPGEDGYTLIRKVRALDVGHGGAVPAIALTAFARSKDRVRAMLAGYNVHVAKPVEPQELIATVATLAGAHRLRAAGGSAH
jgi:CheY-like chemotaxis protein